MKKFLLGTVGLVALGMAAPASAADLPAHPYTKAPPPVVTPVYDWTGFYIGLNGGWGSSRKCWDVTSDATLGIISPFAAEGCHRADGGTAGGQIGYRWQNAQWVFGVEGQGNWADFSGSNPSLFFGPAFTNRSRIDAFGLITGQVGYAWNTVLLYFKGGAAVTSDRHQIFDTPTGILLASTGDQTRWGGTVGVGVEFGFAPNWSAGVEYDHLFMGTKTSTFVDTAGLFFATDRIRQDVDIVTVRVNYRFGGPVIGRY
jgi:outer membrane immunogenic protein